MYQVIRYFLYFGYSYCYEYLWSLIKIIQYYFIINVYFMDGIVKLVFVCFLFRLQLMDQQEVCVQQEVFVL